MPRGDHWPNWRERLIAGQQEAPSGCHEWQRSRNNKGYGVIYFDGKLHLAHRAAWLAHYSEWPPEGLVVDHICNNPACVRIEHLRLLTNGDNIRRAYPRGDEKTERRRAQNNEAKARYRARLQMKRGGSNTVV
ncbi:hypothetical protein NOK12_16790 [Nocardioides sp. OK12]|uniref:HNH endonuclease signature motif containing protein n=1 Tax=Nocardioides sp. OK12 TaxID=2758661 RepID=UPI0021C34941|nr:HNH endonuclease signature motif containing protein [Nocardioides sp. OK12]GHJ59161.1 hypothetical protein NOK12_16790 [Nocardioides sp. OK12]